MTVQSLNAQHKTNASIAGVFYLLAALLSIIPLVRYQPLLRSEDFLNAGAEQLHILGFAAIIDCFSMIAVAGTALMLFPYLRKFNESLALGYFTFRIMEAVSILVSIISLLVLLGLSQTYAGSDHTGTDIYQVTGISLRSFHDWAYIVGPNFLLGINTFIYSYIFLKTELVPKLLSRIGLAAAVLIFFAGILEIAGFITQVSVAGMMFALPIFMYEMTLAVLLISKGFNKRSVLIALQ